MKSFFCESPFWVTLFVIALLWADTPASGQASTADLIDIDQSAAFIESYCIECHSADDPGGQRDFESLDLANSHLDTQLLLQEAIDQLTLGAMPPEDGDQPAMAEQLVAIEKLTRVLGRMRQQSASTGGRTVLRRLSRREYRRTIGDLLAIDMTMFDPTIEFPGDNLAGSFDNVGDALVTSGHLLERYLEAADVSVEKALAITDQPKEQSWVFRGNFNQQAELRSAHRQAFGNRYLCLYDHPLNDKPEGAYGHISEFSSGVPVDGVYEIKVLAQALHRNTPYSNKAVRIDLDEPFRLGIRPGDTSIGDMAHTQPIQPKLGEAVIADDETRWYTFRIPLDKGFAPRFTFENGIHDVRGSFGRLYRLDRDLLPAKIRDAKGIFKQRIGVIQHGQLPHIRIHEVQIRGPVDYRWPNQSQQALWGEDPFDSSKAEQLIERFASRAYRRPATQHELAGLLRFYRDRIAAGQLPGQAFKDTVKAAMCTPAFLYFKQADASKPEQLASHGIAERLSYFLTSTMPDGQLKEKADQGQLLDPDVLRGEVQRLLLSPKSNAFVADFLDNWLSLRTLGTMPPDPSEFWFYYAADLETEMKQETRLFLRDLIDRNGQAIELIGSSHSFVNRDLAKIYGIEDKVPAESANEFRRIEFDDPSRGGLLGQASVLTASANGIETSPVVRGVWLLEHVLGMPVPPPPDDVPAIDPDVRGAQSIRDQLVRHRESEACFQCHRKMDPLGFALEGFDPIGQSRRFYDAKRKLKIDTSGTLPSGDEFGGPAELKTLLQKRETFFARSFAQRLLTHALGRRIEPVDRASVDAILAVVQDQGYPVASLIEEIVVSDLFRQP